MRVWRNLHTALSIVTLALILWHLEFAATLLLRALARRRVAPAWVR